MKSSIAFGRENNEFFINASIPPALLPSLVPEQ